MARTRSKPAPKEARAEPASSTAAIVPPSVANPPKLFVLPKNTSKDSRIVTLDNPASGTPSRYLFCPNKGFHEFTRIAAPKKLPKSWLITCDPGDKDAAANARDGVEDSTQLGAGYITKSADLFLSTPIDTLFILLPALAPKSSKEEKQHFLALDDHLDTLCASSRHLKALLAQHPSLKERIERRMAAVCDTVDAGDETMYRLSIPKLLQVLVKKAERICKNGLPASLEEKFVKPALEVPIMNIKREDTMTSTATAEDSQENTETISQVESQPSTTTTETSTPSDSQTTTTTITSTTQSTSSDPPTDQAPIPALTTPPSIPPLLRLRTALTYLRTAYLPPTLRAPLTTHLTSASTPLDLTPLTTHLTQIASLKTEAQALRSISDNISRKRGFEEDEERAAEREEKKRRKEDEERRKKAESRAVKQLKKVDTSGMRKLSSFFAKKG